MQQKFDHLGDDTLQSPLGIGQILQVLDSLSGEREGDEVRRHAREAIFENAKRSEESLSAYVQRRELQFTKAEGLGLRLPSQIRGVMLEEGAGFNAQGEQNLKVLAAGSLEAEQVAQALRYMDTTRERVTAAQGGLAKTFAEDATLDDEDDDIDSETEDAVLT